MGTVFERRSSVPTPLVQFNLKPNTKPAASRKFLRTADGDTPFIEQPIRMVSCDTPEKAGYAGGPAVAQKKLDTCRARLTGLFYSGIAQELRAYLIARLTPDAATNHIEAGYKASAVFDSLLDTRLTKPGGGRRSVGVIPTGEVVDRYGRMLAYLTPWYAGGKSDPVPKDRKDPRRRTFNLDMIANGWAAFFPIYLSLPGDDDMNMAIAEAETAWKDKKGIWKNYGRKVLLAYEYRMCIKLAIAPSAAAGIKDAFQRECVDLRSLKIVGRQGFWAVPPPYRLWIWKDDLKAAKAVLKLVDPD